MGFEFPNNNLQKSEFINQMEQKKIFIVKLITPLILLTFFLSEKVYSQVSGSLFMLQDNFHSRLLNPSYMRNDDAIVVSVLGFAGARLGNNSSFKIDDLLYSDDENNPAFDFDKLYRSRGGESEYFIKDQAAVPVIYVDIPVSNGRMSFSYEEKLESSLRFNLIKKDFEEGVNSPASFYTYNAKKIKYSGAGYREFSVGYSFNYNEKITLGIRGKLLFGAAFTDIKDWNYGIDYTKSGDQVELRHRGAGKMELPVIFYLSEENLVLAVNSENAFRKYMKNYNNPGLGIDIGATFNFSDRSWFSASVTNLGAIWFRHTTLDFSQDTSYVFSNDDDEIYKYIEYPNSEGYIDPYKLIVDTKDDYAFLYRPVVDTVKTGHVLTPRLTLQYRYDVYKNLSFGFTNQSAFYNNSYLNILSFNVLQRVRELSFFENINMYGTSSFTFGFGMQWETQYFQLFALTDNFEALFKPTKIHSFSMSAGIALLINKPARPKPVRNKNSMQNNRGAKRKRSRGKVSPYLPFYKIKR